MTKSPEAFRTISEVAEWLDVPTHVLRFWESRFTQVKPVKRAGGRRYYRPADMELLGGIKRLLHEDGLTIRGVQKLLREEGVRHVADLSPPADSTVGPRGGDGTRETPAAIDVPAMPPRGEVVDFVPDTGPAPVSDNALDNADAAFNRWPFADEPGDATQDAPEAAPPESEAPAPETTASDAPAPDAVSADRAGIAPAPAQTETRPATSATLATSTNLLALVHTATPAKLRPRAAELRPIVTRLAALHDRLSR